MIELYFCCPWAQWKFYSVFHQLFLECLETTIFKDNKHAGMIKFWWSSALQTQPQKKQLYALVHNCCARLYSSDSTVIPLLNWEEICISLLEMAHLAFFFLYVSVLSWHPRGKKESMSLVIDGGWMWKLLNHIWLIHHKMWSYSKPMYLPHNSLPQQGKNSQFPLSWII